MLSECNELHLTRWWDRKAAVPPSAKNKDLRSVAVERNVWPWAPLVFVATHILCGKCQSPIWDYFELNGLNWDRCSSVWGDRWQSWCCYTFKYWLNENETEKNGFNRFWFTVSATKWRYLCSLRLCVDDLYMTSKNLGPFSSLYLQEWRLQGARKHVKQTDWWIERGTC